MRVRFPLPAVFLRNNNLPAAKVFFRGVFVRFRLRPEPCRAPLPSMRWLALVLLFLIPVCAVSAGELPVVIPGVKGDSRTSQFGSGYITRTSDGKTYKTTKFGDGWITRSSDGKTYTTSKFGDGAITRGNGERVTTTRFGSGTISRSSDGTTTTTKPFGNGTISRSAGGPSTTTTKFGSGFISRQSGSRKSQDQGQVRVFAPPKKK